MSANKWASFLSFDKLDAGKLSNPKHVLQLVELCNKLAEIRAPSYASHAEKMKCRALVCTTAFDLGIDLMAMKRGKYGGGTKVAMGRGLLDVWNAEYAKRFGSIVGTAGAAEITRRTVVTRLSAQMKKEKYEEIQKCISQGWTPKQLVERFSIPLLHAEYLCQQSSNATSAENSQPQGS
jgi:hypothetical protein